MKIYGSTEYIENPKVGDLQLEVNSKWDFCSRSVCFETIKNTFGNGSTTISYDLKECTEVKDSFVIGSNPPKPCKSTKWKEADITDEINNTLIKKGHSLPN